MSNKELQRVTESVSYIGHDSARRPLPSRRHHITQKVKIASQRTLYISVHDDEPPAEIFPRVKGPDCSSELIGLYDVIARLMSQYGAPLEKLVDLLAGAQFAPCGLVAGYNHLKNCSSVPAKYDRTTRSTDKVKRHQMRSPAYKRERRFALAFFSRWLKQVDRWEKDPRYLGVTFPGIKDGDRLAEELVQFARDVVAGRR